MAERAPDESAGPFSALKFFLILTLGVGAASTYATEYDVASWYLILAKPRLHPPDFAFAPIWTVLYIVTALAAWRVWRYAGLKSIALVLFFVQLALSFAWSVLFFRLHEIGWALADIVLLLTTVLWTTIAFLHRDRLAAALMVPYAAWVGFAVWLNWVIWILN